MSDQAAPDPFESPRTFQLITPIDIGAERITELTLYEPTFAQIEQLAANSQKLGPTAAMRMLLMAQTGQPKPVIDAVRARDKRVLEEYIGGFFDDAPAQPSSTS